MAGAVMPTGARRPRRRPAESGPVGHRHGVRARVVTVAVYGVLGVSAILFLIPYYLLIRNGLSTDAEITSPEWTFFPTDLRWENVTELFADTETHFASSLLNSVLVAVLQTTGVLLICSLAGYGLARIPYRHANKIFYAVVVSLMIPGAVTFVPSFLMVSTMGWVSDLRGLIIPGLFSGFTTFLFRQYFLDFPRELEEAARVDGLGYWGAYWRIVFPNSLNFFAAIAAITFLHGWNAFLWPLVIGQSNESWTVQVALSSLLTAQTIRIHELFIGAAISILPLVLVFLFLQRYLVQGVTQSGIKG
ncbi:carbohydrate ABC transporter permease [Phytomonospora sp. NPDC050363]|uniref:carbohydrate ABC transporter permease n=1 Tax=Phytomonospora sp. NPDC050363 TaxID=3155642 RepID=UPI0033DAAE94